MFEHPFQRWILLCMILAAGARLVGAQPPVPASLPSPAVQDAGAEDALEADLERLRTAPHLADAKLLSAIAEARSPRAFAGLAEVYGGGVSPYTQLLILRVLGRFDGVPGAGLRAAALLAGEATSHPFKEVRDTAFRGLESMPQDGPAHLRLIVDSAADDASRVRALEAHVAFGRSGDADWYRRLFDTGRGDEPGAAAPGEAQLAPAPPLDALRAIAFRPIKKSFDEGALRQAATGRFTDVRLAALEELSARGVEDLAELMIDAFENPFERTTTRVWAARRALALVGDKFAKELIDEATRKQSGPLFRDGLAEVLRDTPGEAIDKLVAKRFGKGKDDDKLFDLIAARKHWDPKFERSLLKMIGHRDGEIAERAARLGFELGIEAAGEAILEAFEDAEAGPRRARLLPLVALFETDVAAWKARLASLAKTDAALEVRVAALELLAGFGPGELATLEVALGDARSVVRIAAADALVHVALEERSATVHRRVIEALIARLASETGRVELELTDDLFALTGETYGPRGSAWIGWWEGSGRASFAVPTAAELRLAREKALERRLGSQTQAAFFGIRIRSSRLVFIIDVSGSMEAPTRVRYENEKGMPRITRAKEELAMCLAGLGPESFFNILPFSDKPRPWADELVQCTPEEYEDAREFVDDLKPSGGTNLVGALDLAFADPDVDTIFVLSDGEPTAGWTRNPPEIRAHVAKLNAHRGVVVHAIAIGGSLDILEWLAADSGGEYRAFP